MEGRIKFMNNKQLALLLTSYGTILRLAVEEVAQSLPRELSEEKQIFGSKTTTYPVMEPIVAVIDRLFSDAERMFSSSE